MEVNDKQNDTKQFSMFEGEDKRQPREYLFAAIIPDKTSQSAAKFLEQVIEECR